MSRRAARVDANQAQIVAALERIGASVQSLAEVGQGCPDLVVGLRGRTYLLEVKNPDVPASDRRLTPDQVKWHAAWRGQVAVVTSAEEAIAVVGVWGTK